MPDDPDGPDDNSIERLVAGAVEQLHHAIGVACDPRALAKCRELRVICGIRDDDPLRPESIGEVMRERLWKAIRQLEEPPRDWRYDRIVRLSLVKAGLPRHLGLTPSSRHERTSYRRTRALVDYQETRYTVETMRRSGMLETVLLRHLITQMLGLTTDDEYDGSEDAVA